MSQFVLYTYQFSPIQNRKNLFESELTDEELMNKKQEIFQEMFSMDFKYSRQNKHYNQRIEFNQGNFIIFQLANNKNTILESEFHKTKQPNFPSCWVIIDNRKDMQRIAIEEEIVAFKDTDVVKNILVSTYNKYLNEKGLSIAIQKEYKKSEFWNIVNEYKDDITMVRFLFSYPNLPRVNKTINDIINGQSKKMHSKKTSIQMQSDKQEVLNIDENDNELKDMVNASADSGNIIKIKARRRKSYISTGTDKKIEEIDLETLLTPNLLEEKTLDKIAEIFNNIK